MTNQKNTQSVLVVASGQKSGGFLQEMLPPSKFSPVLTARDVGSAQRMLIERDVDLVLINTPLPDDFGVQLAVEASEKYNCGVLVFVKAELLDRKSVPLVCGGKISSGEFDARIHGDTDHASKNQNQAGGDGDVLADRLFL